MNRDAPPPSEVREALLSDRAWAAETVRGWIAGMVFGARWGLADPDGAIQEVLLRILNLARTGRIRSDTDFKSFVLTIARHTCTDIYRREKLRGSIEAPATAIESHRAATGNPERHIEETERRLLLRFIFQELSEECRRLWRLVYGEGLPAAEVAARLGISAGNVRVRTHRCLKKARDIHRDYVPGARSTA